MTNPSMKRSLPWLRRRITSRKRARLLLPCVALCLLTTALAACGSSKSSSTTPTSSAGASGSSTAHGTPIVIGSIGSYTSAAGSTIAPMGPALQAWAASVNASGGIDGHPLDLILKEDGNTPATGLAEAQELVNDHVVALVFDGSFTDYAWSSIFKKAGIPVVGGSSATIQPNNPLYFPSGTTTAALSYGIEYALKLEGVTKVAVPYCAEIAACATAVNTAKPAAEAVGLQVVWGGGVSGSSPDLTPQCIAAKSAGADGVEVALTEQESIHFAEDCAQQGWHPVYGFSTNGINDDLLHIPALATQTISTSGQTTVPWFLNSTPALQAFHAAMAKYAPGTKLTSGAAHSRLGSVGCSFKRLFKLRVPPR